MSAEERGTGRRKLAVLVAALGVLGGCLAVAVVGLRPFGEVTSAYGSLANRLTLRADALPEVVTSVTYGVRSLDSLGETFILFGAVTGVALLLREGRDEEGERPLRARAARAVRAAGFVLVPVLIVVGLWDATTAGLSPGNGFQVGVILAAGALVGWATGPAAGFRAATPTALATAVEALGAAGLVGVGLVGLGLSGVFLSMFLGPGPYATIRSGGVVLVFSWTVAVEVTAGNVLLLREFLKDAAPDRAAGPAPGNGPAGAGQGGGQAESGDQAEGGDQAA